LGRAICTRAIAPAQIDAEAKHEHLTSSMRAVFAANADVHLDGNADG
jgi:hypothetical protein